MFLFNWPIPSTASEVNVCLPAPIWSVCVCVCRFIGLFSMCVFVCRSDPLLKGRQWVKLQCLMVKWWAPFGHSEGFETLSNWFSWQNGATALRASVWTPLQLRFCQGRRPAVPGLQLRRGNRNVQHTFPPKRQEIITLKSRCCCCS